MSKANDPRITTTDGFPPDPGFENASAPGPIGPSGQHRAYWVLTVEERNKGFVRPLRSSYVHEICGGLTSMGRALSETYARDPKFYSHTFCVHCHEHRPVEEFRWDSDGQIVGS
ncbi:MAG TPA: hypothetical protein VIO11_05775 [Candidatus Methanoperedens sp.]